MMDIEIIAVERDDASGASLVTVRADIGAGPEVMPYVLTQGDTSPMSEAVRAALPDWQAAGGVIQPYTQAPTYPTLAAAKVAMVAWIEQLSDELTGKRPLAEKLSWPTKLAAAQAAQTGAATAEQINMIATEAQLRGVTTEALAALIIEKGMKFATIAAAIAGLRARTEAALEAVVDPAGYEAVLVQAAQAATALKAELV